MSCRDGDKPPFDSTSLYIIALFLVGLAIMALIAFALAYVLN